MNIQFAKTLAMIVVVLSFVPAATEAQTLKGSDSGRPPVFSVVGPWLMDWRAKSEFPMFASIEILLYDGQTNEYVGRVAELRGTGNGLKYFESGGTYQIVIVGTSVEWEIEIQEISEEQGAVLKRQAGQTPSLAESTRRVSRLVPESSFESWRPEGNDTLLLFDDGSLSWRISFSPDCPGLESATAISFVMPSGVGMGQYDSILLDDGTRCYFDSVGPGGM